MRQKSLWTVLQRSAKKKMATLSQVLTTVLTRVWIQRFFIMFQKKWDGKGNSIQAVTTLKFATTSILLPLKKIIPLLKIISSFLQKTRCSGSFTWIFSSWSSDRYLLLVHFSSGPLETISLLSDNGVFRRWLQFCSSQEIDITQMGFTWTSSRF